MMLIRNRWFILHIGEDMARLLRWSFFLGIQPRWAGRHHQSKFGITLGFGFDVPRLMRMPVPYGYRRTLICPAAWTGREREVVELSWPRYVDFTATPWPLQ